MSAKEKEVLEHEDVVVPFNKLHFDPKNPRGVDDEPDEEKIKALFSAQPKTLILEVEILSPSRFINSLAGTLSGSM